MNGPIDTIWKYAVPVNDQVVPIGLPRGAEIVHVDCQDSDVAYEIQFWVTIPVVFIREVREFRVFGTGQSLPYTSSYNWVHRGTVLTHGGQFVWHLMELVGE